MGVAAVQWHPLDLLLLDVGEDEPDIPPDVREQTFPEEMDSTSTGRPCDLAHT